jgi:hypothetical protein
LPDGLFDFGDAGGRNPARDRAGSRIAAQSLAGPGAARQPHSLAQRRGGVAAPSAGVMKSPLNLKVKLQAFGGAKIDPDSIVVTYKKTPMIDITQRIMPYISADGIEVPEAEVPPGLHEFRIELRDKEGRLGGTEFSFQIGK